MKKTIKIRAPKKGIKVKSHIKAGGGAVFCG
jgi:hypothetical protein